MDQTIGHDFEELTEQEAILKEHAAVTSDESVDYSMAYTFIKDLLGQKQMTVPVGEDFKRRYRQMHEAVSEYHKNERNMLKKAKALRNEALGEAIRLHKAELAHDDVLRDIERLEKEREALGTHLVELEQQDTMLRYEVGELHNTRADLEALCDDLRLENERLVGPELEGLQLMLGNLQDEHKRLSDSHAKDQERQEQLKRRSDEIQMERADLEHAISTAENNLGKVRNEPERLNKQAESVSRATESLRRKIKRISQKITDLDEEIGRMEEQRIEAEGLKAGLDQKLQLHRDTIGHRQKDVEAVTKNLEIERARHHQLLTEKLELDMQKKEAEENVRREKDALTISRKEFERLKRKLRNKLQIANGAAEVIPALETQLKDIQAELMSFQLQNKDLSNRLEVAKEDVDIGIARFLKQESVEMAKGEGLSVLVEEVERLEAECSQWGTEESRQEKLVGLLSAQREIKATEAMRAQEIEKETKEQVKIKQLVILDLMKRYNDVTNRLKEFSALYDVVKNERNKYVNLIQASNQALAEMKEKIKILHNEVDILRNESVAKDKALQKEKMAHIVSQQQRDALRLDTNKAMLQYRNRQNVVEQQIMEIQKLNSTINELERDMLSLKGRYESAVESRNFMGVQLIDRNDELCILYEKANLQESTLTDGAWAIHRKEEDLRMLKLQAAELERRLEVTHRLMPAFPAVAERILKMQTELRAERVKTEQLSQELEDPSNEGRWRALEGEDPDPEQLQAKIQVLEERLSQKKEQLLEKELVLEEVTALTQKLRYQASEGREATVELAKKINDFQGRITDTTRKMMATVSELSMHQATAMKLQQEKLSREKDVKEAKRRVQLQQSPSEEAEKEWMRALRDYATAEAQRYGSGQPRGGASHGYTTTGGGELPSSLVRTTAEPRPNAYIPDELGIPKPYGALAPFKPTEAGTIMRFIRAPQPKEIEI